MASPTIQQRAAAVVAIVILVAIVLWLMSLALPALDRDGSVGERPRLNWQWAVLKWWIGDSSTIGKIFATLLILLSTAIQFLSKMHTKIWSILLICGLCLLGIAAAILFLIYGNDPSLDIFKQFRSVVGGAPETVSGKVTTVIGATIGWLVAFMAVQLGISLKQDDGALNNLGD